MQPTAATRITGLHRWPGFLEGLWDIVARGTHTWYLGDRALRACHFWFRDHLHMLKFARYFDADPCSALQFLIDHQHPSGFFYEILTSGDDPHVGILREPYRKAFDTPLRWDAPMGDRPRWRENAWLLRLPLEPDIEYLMIEGAARAWEATGDRAWLEGALPALERGLAYSLTHPDRFDPAHGLVKRAFTIDTWDFCWGRDTTNRDLDTATPMAIHYGDNAGVYGAARWLAAHRPGGGCGGRTWLEWAEHLRRRTNKVCWNGQWYTHQVLLDPVDTGGPPEEAILSLSNAYAVNRGLATHAQAVAILVAYQRLREEVAGKAVAEWFTIYPPYPKFAKHPRWDYVNGGIAPFVAGELAMAALAHGHETYGVDLLDRLFQWWQRDGTLDFLYTKDGKPQAGGPPGWGAAAIGQALLEGLAGVRMDAAERRVRLAPRWVAAGEDDVTVEAAYPASGYGVRYRFVHRPDERTIRLELATPDAARVSLLLPPGTAPTAVSLDGRAQAWTEEHVEQSCYARADLPAGEAETVRAVNVTYARQR